jgi:hypothetical protein
VTDFLAEKRREIDDRLVELKPLLTEYERLEAASKALVGVPASKSGAAVSVARPRGPRVAGRVAPLGQRTKRLVRPRPPEPQ